MPLYTIKNTKTEEVTDVLMKHDELQKHLAENPHLERVWNVGSPGALHYTDVRHELTKKGPGEAFNNKLKAISKAHPGSSVNHW